MNLPRIGIGGLVVVVMTACTSGCSTPKSASAATPPPAGANATVDTAPPTAAPPASAPPVSAPPAKRYLTDAQEEELATLLTRALVSDEEHKSRAQDEGRFAELIRLMTKDLATAKAENPSKTLSDAERSQAARIADARLMDVMRRRAPQMARIMEENQQLKRCRRMSDVARLRLRAFYVSQELFRADHKRYGLLSELPKEALPAARERKIFQFDLVKSTKETFLYRATGRGDSIAAGAMWEIDHMGIAQEVISGCKPSRSANPAPAR